MSTAIQKRRSHWTVLNKAAREEADRLKVIAIRMRVEDEAKLEQIAVAVGRSKWTVAKWMTEAGLSLTKKRKPKIKDV